MSEDHGESVSFDLSELIQREQQRNSSRRLAQAYVGVSFGVALAIVGVYIGFIHQVGPALPASAEGIVAIIVGVLLAMAAWAYSVRAYRRAPNLLVVSNESIAYGRREDPSSLTRLNWDTPRLRLVLYDRTNLRAKLDERDRFAAFSFVPPGGPSIPLTKAAFDAVLAEAQKRGLSLKRQELGSVGVLTLRADTARRD